MLHLLWLHSVYMINILLHYCNYVYHSLCREIIIVHVNVLITPSIYTVDVCQFEFATCVYFCVSVQDCFVYDLYFWYIYLPFDQHSNEAQSARAQYMETTFYSH